MSENKTLYIERLLNEIKSLYENVLEVNESGNLPFSFFKESFNKTQEISRLLHDLEFTQVDDLKSQMERLVVVLSEKDKIIADMQEETAPVDVINGNIYARDLELPGYRNPYKNNTTTEPQQSDSKPATDLRANPRSLNDVVKTPPPMVDLKKSISVNDRFLFQRELFGNDRHRMTTTIEKINDLESYERAEEYIKENVSADLDDPVVTDFLSIIRKGFKLMASK